MKSLNELLSEIEKRAERIIETQESIAVEGHCRDSSFRPATDCKALLAVIRKLIGQRDNLALFSPAQPTVIKDEMNTELLKILAGEK